MIIRKMLEINCFLSKRDILSKNIKSNVLFSLLLIEVAQVELWEPPAFFHSPTVGCTVFIRDVRSR